jgi:hypothetical protein
MITLVSSRRKYKKIIHVSDEGLIFKDTRTEVLKKWDQIKHIFHWTRSNLLVVIDKNGDVLAGNAFPDKSFQKSSQKVGYIWDTWKIRLKNAQPIGMYEYPNWCSQEESYIASQNIFWGLGAGVVLLFFSIKIFFDEDWRKWEGLHEYIGPFVGIMFSLYCFWCVAYSFVLRSRMKIKKLDLDGNSLRAAYNNGSIDVLDIRDIKKYRLKNPRNWGYIVFQNGTKLKALDRLSYWPVLQEHLLSKLEQKQ